MLRIVATLQYRLYVPYKPPSKVESSHSNPADLNSLFLKVKNDINLHYEFIFPQKVLKYHFL